jgi:phosphonate transport system substrate-binding protein
LTDKRKPAKRSLVAGSVHPPPLRGARVRVGIALTNGSTREHVDTFCRALSAATELDVTGIALWHYHRLLEALEAGDVDVAWLPPLLAAQATHDGRAIPLAVPVRGGVSSYSTALFVLEHSRLRSAQDLVGVRAAWVDRQSVSGYLLIRAHLRSLGVTPERAFTSDRFFGSHEAVVRAVVEDSADVGATFIHLDERPGRQEPRILRAGWGDAKVRVIAHAGPIPSDVVAASTGLGAAEARLVQDALLHGRHAALRAASLALTGADVFVTPVAAHLRGLALLLPGMDEHALPRMGLRPKG